MVQNPKAAIGAAIVLSITRAGIESAFRMSIERALMSNAASIAGGAAAGIKGGLLANGGMIAAGVGTFLASMGATLEALKAVDKEFAADSRGFGPGDIYKDVSEAFELSGRKKKKDGKSTDIWQALGEAAIPAWAYSRLLEKDEGPDLSGLRSDNPEIIRAARERFGGGGGGGTAKTTDPEATEVLRAIHRTLQGPLKIDGPTPGTSTQSGDGR